MQYNKTEVSWNLIVIKEIICFFLLLILATACGNYHLYNTNKNYSWDTGNGERIYRIDDSSVQFGEEMGINSVMGM